MYWSMPLIILILICCYNCKTDNQKKAVAYLGDELPEDFLAFYHDFHKDSLFQLEHIVFPLEGKRPDTTGVLTWQKESWIMHRSFKDMGAFTRKFTNMNGIVIENIEDNSGQYNMERRWSKLAGEWNLIYYREIGNISEG